MLSKRHVVDSIGEVKRVPLRSQSCNDVPVVVSADMEVTRHPVDLEEAF